MRISVTGTACALVAALATTSIAACSREYTAGTVTVVEPWSRATAEGAPVGVAYMTIKNTGAIAITLVGGTTPLAETVEVHTMTMEGEVMRMRPLSDGLQIPPGGAVELKPGANHLMLIGLKRKLTEGESLPLTLTFEPAATITVEVAVKAAGDLHGH